MRAAIERITVSPTSIKIVLSAGTDGAGCGRSLAIPWAPRSTNRRREIVQAADNIATTSRPMRSNAKAIMIEALRNAHRWVDELLADPKLTVEAIGAREGKGERSIRMILSLAFLAPDLVTAAIEGRLPRGFGVKRLIDSPLLWADQWRGLGLEESKESIRTDTAV